MDANEGMGGVDSPRRQIYNLSIVSSIKHYVTHCVDKYT